MDEILMNEEDDNKSEISNADNRSSKFEKEQNNYNYLNLKKSLKSEEIKNTIFNIFDSYYQSDNTRLKNIAKKSMKI